MSLNDQLNSFRNKIKNAPVLAQKRFVDPKEPDSPKRQKLNANTTPSGISSSINGSNGSTGSNSDSSTPAARALAASTPAAIAARSTHKSTLLLHAVEYIKREDRPVKFSEIESYLSMSIDGLLPILKGIDRIEINEQERSARYVSIFGIYSAQELLAYLRSQPTFKGSPVNKLKDGWNGCLAAIDELEKKNDIIVLRNKKDRTPQYVWANVGGPIGQIDDEFVQLWTKAKVPAAAELPAMLTKVNLKPTSVDPATLASNKPNAAEQRKQKKPRRSKITNVHMQGVLKEYNL